jgi:hypothetical protein
MDDDYREAVRLCFPSKFASYVAARVPIFYHGPKDSTIARFLDRYGVGLGCHSFEPDEILSSLHNILTDSDKQQEFRRSCDDAYREELGPHVFRHRFSKFVDIDENSLAPLT